MSLIQVEDLTVRYGASTALSGVSLHVEPEKSSQLLAQTGQVKPACCGRLSAQ